MDVTSSAGKFSSISGVSPPLDPTTRAVGNDALFQGFFEQAPFYVGILSPQGRVTVAGRLSLEACGYTEADVLGKLFWETAWWRDSTEVQSRIKRAFESSKNGERFQATLPYLTADGTACWVDFGLSPVFDRSGALDFVIAHGTDVTERVRSENELATARKRLDSALIAAEMGTYQWDVISDRLYADGNLERIFGLTLDASGSAPLQNFVGMIHPEDQERVTRHVLHSVATGENFEQDYRIAHPDGERWVNSRGRMIKDDAGRVVNFFGLVMDITARKRAEQERDAITHRLGQLTALHQTVLSGTNDFAYVFDLAGRFLYANRPLLELYGRRLDDVVGKTFIQLGYPAWHAEMHLREIAQVVATKRPLQGEIPFRGESGISGVYDYIFTPVFGADGQVEAVAGTTRDVTERKRGEARDRLLVALDDATRPLTDPAAITDACAQVLVEFLGVNRCAYADVDEDENTFNLTGNFNRDVPSITGRYRFDQFGEDCLRLMRAGEPFVVADSETDPRTEAVRDVYRKTQIRAMICVPLTKSGRFAAAIAVHQNIARAWLESDVEAVRITASRCWESIERTRVVRILAESEQRLRLAVSTGRLGVWELNLATHQLTCSAQHKANYGREAASDFLYEDVMRSVATEDVERMQKAVERAIADSSEFDLEHRITWPDGSSHWVLVRGQADRREGGGPSRMVGVSLDITARKQAESEQVRLREEAVRASRAKDDFLATLSHELRTPLNPVLLIASDAARDATLPPETRQSFEIIRKNVELEARLIDDLLDLTKIVRGKLAMLKAPRDLHAILHDVVASVRADFSAKNIGLLLKLDAPSSTVWVDEVRIVQVFTNLLSNAAKFTPVNGAVTLQTETTAAGNIAVRLTDTGIGLTREELGRVFSAFEQGDHASERGSHRFGGLGLGLAISQRLVEMHGGHIEAQSEGRDRGSSFITVLPLHTPAEDTAAPESSPALPSLREHPRQTARILLVEDHEATRVTLEQLLRRRNYQVVSAASLAAARQRAREETFDLVISDVGLPDGDGAALMAELRDEYKLRGIALTGFGMEEDIARCRAAGFVAHLTKPISLELLESALHEIFAIPDRD